jgi:hypothetical protein
MMIEGSCERKTPSFELQSHNFFGGILWWASESILLRFETAEQTSKIEGAVIAGHGEIQKRFNKLLRQLTFAWKRRDSAGVPGSPCIMAASIKSTPTKDAWRNDFLDYWNMN